MRKHTAIAKAVILAYLGNGLKPEGLYDIYEINRGNKKVLLGHIMALKTIFEKAIEEIENERTSS